ncbi:MAG: hypothetical protein ABEH43_02175 [Flavobacteriales bacterium]
MIRPILPFIFLSLTLSGVIAQNDQIEWESNYGGGNYDLAESIQHTADGGYIIAGYSYSSGGDISGNNGNADFWVAKLDTSGAIEWENNYGGSANDRAHSIKLPPTTSRW